MRRSASAYYRAALRADPKNPVLLERTFLSVMIDGEVDEAVKLAERVIQFDKTHRVARLVLGVRALKAKQYQAARQHIAQSVRGPIADLTATLITAWTQYGSQDAKAAIESIDRLAGPEWYAVFKDLHAGLISDRRRQPQGSRQAVREGLQARRQRVARRRGLRTLDLAPGRQGRGAEDLRGLRQGAAAASADRRGDERDQGRRKTSARSSNSPQAGAAEVLFGLGTSLGRQGGEDLALAYLQLAIYLAPTPSARADVARRPL